MGALGRIAAILSVAAMMLVIGFILKEATNSFSGLRSPNVTPIETPGPLGPSFQHHSVLRLVTDSLIVSFGACLLVFPLGVAAALYITEIAPPYLSAILKGMLKVLSAVPTTVIGFLGIMLFFSTSNFDLPPSTLGMLATPAVLLAIAIYPTFVTDLIEKLSAVPLSFKATSYALGGSPWDTIRYITWPAARPWAVASGLTSLKRVLGEAIIVLLLVQVSSVKHLVAAKTPITLPVAIVLGTSSVLPNTSGYYTLFLLGLILLLADYALHHLARRLTAFPGGEWE